MDKEFVKYETALALKELGFDEPCLTYYNYDKRIERSDDWAYGCTLIDKRDRNQCLAPLYQQAFRWFREKYGLYSAIVPKKSWPDNFVSGIEWYVEICGGNGIEIGPDGTYSYKEAESACLDKLIEIIKNK